MQKLNKLFALLGVVIVVLAMLIQFNASYNFLVFLDGYTITGDVVFYVLISFVFLFSFMNLAKKSLFPIIFICVLIVAFILLVIMTSFPDIVLKIIPAKA